MIVASGLGKVYPTRRGDIVALADVTLAIDQGEFVAVSGRSGSGKSTLLAILGGLCRPDNGSLAIDGADILALNPARLADFRGQSVGFVFQFASLLANLRAIDNVALPALISGAGNLDQCYRRAERALDEVGLADRFDAYPGELSGGQQRRVAIARALINQPPLILADEPTNDLDEETEREIFALLVSLQRTRQCTLVLVTHRPELARQADRVLHLQGGRLVSSEAGAGPRNSAPIEIPAPTSNPQPLTMQLKPAAPAPLGVGLSRFLIDFAGWTLLIALVIFGLNYGIATLQQVNLNRQRTAHRAVEKLALQTLRADVENVADGPDGEIHLSIYLSNADSEQPLFVLGPSMRAFVQVGTAWQAIPIVPVEDEAESVTRIDGRRVFQFTFRADVTDYTELLRGYLHIRFSNSMIVAASAEPEEIFARNDDYYIYLRAPNLTEDEVRDRNGWKPGSLIPRWIGMPPH